MRSTYEEIEKLAGSKVHIKKRVPKNDDESYYIDVTGVIDNVFRNHFSVLRTDVNGEYEQHTSFTYADLLTKRYVLEVLD